MKYFEFIKQEYWALVVAESVEKAYAVYAEESASEVAKEGPVDEISRAFAFGKYLNAVAGLEENQGKELKEYICEFAEMENIPILITSELA
ncbi:hypothetical protein [Bacillus cereus group sp. RP43]|uniref:hypothetical protein n=1 Tax=Bacillus cereus group sp. RP43 TaxID=3040260 RepID=UPI003390AA39